ncbi:response regulator transcription factor [Sinanaerobacter sp. ZZT-01]|uniref:response regulator transcription factor n=1 Tax=Sinanaerobacter sp. ZZT-01 TaxID=3111540 RepID=UPI002D78399E|nr:response regulator transcription factor [Sinanaerobacter sp. ZZT-01]WRR92832.1 response regulator transcription factor [Sinanaerobacter sp. ZZT-01]
MYRILIVEDELVIAEALKEHLSKWGYDVTYITDFKEIMAQFIRFNPQMVLMDISLPFLNGYHWCTEIRKISSVPIVFLSSAADNLNVVMAINMGADDFIAKPFDLSVLTAKIQALMRRSYSLSGQVNVMEHKGVILNISSATLAYENEKIELTKNDFKLMQILFEKAGTVVSRDSIMTRLWEDDNFVDDNTLTVNIARIRKKLEDIGLTDFIKTKKGIGYFIE